MHLGNFHQGREGAHQWTQIESNYNDYFKHANELKTYLFDTYDDVWMKHGQIRMQ